MEGTISSLTGKGLWVTLISLCGAIHIIAYLAGVRYNKNKDTAKLVLRTFKNHSYILIDKINNSIILKHKDGLIKTEFDLKNEITSIRNIASDRLVEEFNNKVYRRDTSNILASHVGYIGTKQYDVYLNRGCIRDIYTLYRINILRLSLGAHEDSLVYLEDVICSTDGYKTGVGLLIIMYGYGLIILGAVMMILRNVWYSLVI